MSRLLFAVLSIFLASTSWAQVVIPSLDKSLPVEMASAVSWRIGSTIGIGTTFAQDETEAEKVDYYNNENAVLMAYQPGSVVGELYYTPVQRMNDWDTSSDALTTYTGLGGRFQLAIRGENRVSVGIGYGLDQADISSDTVKKNNYYEGSFSLRMLGGLYVGAGLQRTKLTYGSIGTLKRNRVVAGVALLLGNPMGNMFRTEASYKLSPEAQTDDEALTLSKTSEMQLSVEVLFADFLFSFLYQKTVMSDYNGSSNAYNIENNRYGLGYKLGSFTLGLYRHAGSEMIGDYRLVKRKYQCTMSFNFI
ncbi:MAG: hypothetical protein GY866_42425 [Proteobacteria bacterium]|nr:hypothetical protein [Pseudomonadota bacterium]